VSRAKFAFALHRGQEGRSSATFTVIMSEEATDPSIANSA